jgi:DNA polymerase III delta prime subunit
VGAWTKAGKGDLAHGQSLAWLEATRLNTRKALSRLDKLLAARGLTGDDVLEELERKRR